MHRSRQPTAVRHVLSTSLLGMALLGPAVAQAVGQSAVWTRVDLDSVVALDETARPPAGTPTADKALPPPSEGKPSRTDVGAMTAAARSEAPLAGVPVDVRPLPDVPLPEAPPAPTTGTSLLARILAATKSVAQPGPAPIAAAPGAAVPEPDKGEPLVDIGSPVAVVAAPTAPALAYALSPSDRTIRAGLERWSKNAGWKLSWELPADAQSGVVRFDADFGADFDVALSKLASTMRSENRVRVYLYAENKVLRLVEEPVRPVASAAAPLTPALEDKMPQDPSDRGLPYVTRLQGYWLGSAGTESPDGPAQALPPVLTASVALVFSDKASLATVTGILTKVTRIPIALPGAIEQGAASLFAPDKQPDYKGGPKKSVVPQTRLSYRGTPKELLDRISVSTGLLWDFKDGTIVFSE